MKGKQLRQVGLTAGVFALGAAAGSALALLLAPSSGKMLRRRIGSGLRTAGRSAERQLKRTRKVLAKRAGALKSAASEKICDTREWILERVPNGSGKHHHALSRRGR